MQGKKIVRVRQLRVAIIGGGFSGAMTAVHLLRQETPSLEITIFEPRSELGRGLAYSTPCDDHLLNVPAFRMSALPDEPDHFLEYVRIKNKSVSEEAFVPRKVYGEYLGWLIASELAQSANKDKSVNHVLSEVTDVTRLETGYRLHLSDKECIEADCVVLALGNLSGKRPNWLTGISMECKDYLHNPWQLGAIEKIALDEDVFIVGTGLTAVDKIIQLERVKHRGAIFALSRHGWLPRTHLDRYQGRAQPLATESKSALAALKILRRQIATISLSPDGDTWRRVIDGLQPTTQAWWQSLPVKEQRCFLTHLNSLWDVHRHRMAPHIGHVVDESCSSGQVKILAGRIVRIQEQSGYLTVEVRERGKKEVMSFKANKIINCTGPESSLKNADSALLANLLERGLVAPHRTGTGIAARADGQVVDKLGNPVSGLFTIGRMLKAQLLESVAVPVLKQQAVDLAEKIVRYS
jgi:uncharacterized NAD(P)/FAD-binding protein YdhS